MCRLYIDAALALQDLLGSMTLPEDVRMQLPVAIQRVDSWISIYAPA